MNEIDLRFERNFVACRIKHRYKEFLKWLAIYSIPITEVVITVAILAGMCMYPLGMVYTGINGAEPISFGEFIVAYVLLEGLFGGLVVLIMDARFHSNYDPQTHMRISPDGPKTNDLWQEHYRALFASEIFIICAILKINGLLVVWIESQHVLYPLLILVPVVLVTVYLFIDWVCSVEKYRFISNAIRANPVFATGYDLNPPVQEQEREIVNQYTGPEPEEPQT
jgi:hypothetical protein